MKNLNWKNFFTWWGIFFFILFMIWLIGTYPLVGIILIVISVILLIVGVSIELLNEQ